MSKQAKATRVVKILSWVGFGLLSSLIIAESCVPTDASGKQSFSFSKIMADIINAITPTKKAVTLEPTGVTSTATSRNATIDGKVVSLFEPEEAIVGTTKLYSYTLTYPEMTADIYDSSVKFEFLSTPGEDSYTHTFTTGKTGGALRIIPLLEGEYRFRLLDAVGHESIQSFTAKKRIAPKQIKGGVDAFSLRAGEYGYYPFELTFGDMTVEGEEVSHYLARYWDASLTKFTSSNPAVFTVEDGGLLHGVSSGIADLLYEGKTLAHIDVAGDYLSKVASIELTASKETLSPLDYDYEGYGAQIDVSYYDAEHHLLDVNEPLVYSSEDELIAKVDEHGFVSGYRKNGSTRVKVSLAGHPEIYAYQSFQSVPAQATSVEIKALSGGKTLPLTGASLKAGDSISFSATFLPINTADKRLHVDIGTQKNVQVINNDTNTPSLSFLDGGDFTFTVSSLTLGEQGAVTYSCNVAARQAIEDKDMTQFHQFIRKAAGHFMLFFVTGLFGTLAFILTFFPNKKWGMFASSGLTLLSGVALAGISEAIQAIPALRRGATFEDVLIDSSGYLFAVLLVLGVYALVRFLVNRKHKNKEQE